MSPTGNFERKLFQQGHRAIAAADEVGRGAWAGPIVGGAVLVDGRRWKHIPSSLLRAVRDSKLLSRAQREKLFQPICNFVNAWSTVSVGVCEIDRRGLQPANYSVLRRAILKLRPRPSLVLLDGFAIDRLPYPSRAIVHGDRDVFIIACASILAKVSRDRMMHKYHKRFPYYGFDQHVGYGTKKHQEALYTHGPCSIHRKSFAPVRDL